MSPVGSGPSPMSTQRSRWERHETQLLDGVEATVWRRRVHDGLLFAIVALEPSGWHLSISHRRPSQKPSKKTRLMRYPTWDEISHARYELLPDEITVAMFLPPPEEYVAVHDTTFHLHEVAGE